MDITDSKKIRYLVGCISQFLYWLNCLRELVAEPFFFPVLSDLTPERPIPSAPVPPGPARRRSRCLSMLSFYLSSPEQAPSPSRGCHRHVLSETKRCLRATKYDLLRGLSSFRLSHLPRLTWIRVNIFSKHWKNKGVTVRLNMAYIGMSKNVAPY